MKSFLFALTLLTGLSANATALSCDIDGFNRKVSVPMSAIGNGEAEIYVEISGSVQPLNVSEDYLAPILSGGDLSQMHNQVYVTLENYTLIFTEEQDRGPGGDVRLNLKVQKLRQVLMEYKNCALEAK